MRTNLIVVDCETKKMPNGVHILRLAVIRNGDDYFICYTVEEITRTILSLVKRRSVNLVVAHNLQFDFFFVDKEIIKREGFELKFISFTPCVIKFAKLNRENKREYINLVFLDSMNYFRNALDELGETFSLPKLEIDFETCTMAELEEYCRRDVDITYKIMEFILEMHKIYKIKKLCISISQLSYTIYKRDFLKMRLYSPSNKEIMRLERDSYRGGRTEVFRHGEYRDIPLYYYDVNSMYPYVMRNNRFPTAIYAIYYPENLRGLSLEKRKDIIDKFLSEEKLVIVRCHVEEYTKYPLIGAKDSEKRLMFPQKKDAVICTPEYMKCRDNITRIDQFVVYNSDYIFRDFVDHFYSKRINANDEVMKLFYKTLLNSLYGKFGQRKFNTKISPVDFNFFGRNGQLDIVEEDNTVQHGKVLFGYFIEEETDEMNPRAFVAIASHVTAHARCVLSKMIDDNTFYCDTDSIITDRPISDEVLGKELGQWKLEADSTHSIFIAPKHYYFNGKWKRKGVPKRAKQLDGNRVAYNKFTKMRESYRRHGGQLKEIEVIKELKCEDKKRIHNSDGSTSPLPSISSHSPKTRSKKSP